MPASPKETTGPKSGSSVDPTTHATPGVDMCCSTSRSAASGSRLSDIERNAVRTARSFSRLSRRPPRSVREEKRGSSVFSTTG